MSLAPPRPGFWGSFWEEARKVPAFFRRDLLVMLSYRFALVGDWLNLVVQVVVFFFVGQLVSPDRLPSFGGAPPSYMEYVVVGLALTAFLQIGINRVVAVIRQEQFMGTLEPLLAAPISPATLQLGSVIYDLFYVPIRSFAFLILAALLFDVGYRFTGLGLAALVLLVFIPFVWGLGMMASASVLTFKRGAGVVGFAGIALTVASGTYFPLDLLPDWLSNLAEYNPVAIALRATHVVLLGDTGWADTWPQLLILLPIAAVTLAAGLVAFELALNRERRRGTVGMY